MQRLLRQPQHECPVVMPLKSVQPTDNVTLRCSVVAAVWGREQEW